MSNETKKISVIYGVSDQQCKNRKLFDYVEQWQNTDKTLLQFFSRNDEGGKEHFIGLPLRLDDVGKIDCFYLILIQDILEKDTQFLASSCQPKVYFL